MLDVDHISIEPSRGRDLDAVRRLLSGASLPADGIEDVDRLFVARSGKLVVGAAALELYLPQALLRSVIVSDRARGHGVGGRLVQLALSEASRSGVSQVLLLTLDATEYFERFGFRVVQRSEITGRILDSREFTVLCPDSATAMVRDLADCDIIGG